MFCEKFTIIRHHTECSFPMQKWSRARLRYGIHSWWLHNAKGVGPGQIQEIRDCSFSFESLRSLLRKPLFPAKWIISELLVTRDQSEVNSDVADAACISTASAPSRADLLSCVLVSR